MPLNINDMARNPNIKSGATINIKGSIGTFEIVLSFSRYLIQNDVTSVIPPATLNIR